MSPSRISALRPLEGRRVCIALAAGGRIDDCELVSAGRGSAATMWVFANGADAFLPHREIVDLWEASP
jgi:hypothetical protein